MNTNIKKIDETTKIDKITLKDICILKIADVNDLIDRKILRPVIDEHDRCCYVTEHGQKFDYIHIKDDGVINNFKASCTGIGQYCTLQTSVNKPGLINLESNSFSEYWQQLRKIKQKLIDDYGIYVDIVHSKLSMVEVNRTFEIQNNFEAYDRVLKLIISEMPRMKMFMDAGVVDKSGSADTQPLKIQTYYAKSGEKTASKMVKFYAKSEQLKCKIFLDANYMRFEITLKGSKHIKRAFGMDSFDEMSQDIFDKWFKKQVQTLIVNPVNKWRKSNQKYLKTVLEEELEHGGRWKVNTLRRLMNDELSGKRQFLLDINDLMAAVDKMKIQHKGRTKKRFIEQCQKYETVFCDADGAKLDEVIEKLTATPADTVYTYSQDKYEKVATGKLLRNTDKYSV